MDFFIQKIAEKIKEGLPGDDAHLHLIPQKRLSARKLLASQKEYRSSAVGIILYPKNNNFHSLLIQRSTYIGNHSGQVSFPGGKKDQTDINLEHTARRECFEEVNFPLESGQLIGTLSPIYIPVSNFMVTPFLFYTKEEPKFVANDREVEHLIPFKLKILLDDGIQKKGTIRISEQVRQKDVPYFEIENKIVWGATAMMLSELKEILKRLES